MLQLIDFSKIRKIMKVSNYIFIFLAGVFCSILFFLVLHQINVVKYSQLNHLPDEKYIQVRDDFSIFIPNQKSERKQINNGNVQEALSNLKVALEMRAVGKDEKALRLFQHALALAPKHPEILVKYGEYLEHNKDILMADQMYLQALTINPSNTEAITNRQRTAHIVEALDSKRLNVLDLKRDVLSGINDSNSALRRAKKEAYFQHIYHSVGIEGNTMTLAQTRSVIETRMAVDGKSIDEHNEIIGLDAAIKYINASLVNK